MNQNWIQYFAAQDRARKLKDNKVRGKENEIINLFLALAGCEATMKIYFIAYP